MQSHKCPDQKIPILSFDGVLVIVGGGTVDGKLLAQLHADGAHVIAADSGAKACDDAGIMPEAIIGDMDSLSDLAGWGAKTQLMALEEQDTTDFEKCLYSTQAPLTLALGMTGKRFDHTLAALNALARLGGARRIVLVDEEDIALSLSGRFSFFVAAGERVSVHPLDDIVFEGSTGLKYDLEGVALSPMGRTGTSNQAVNGAFEIVPQAGEVGAYLLIVAKNYLGDIIKRFA